MPLPEVTERNLSDYLWRQADMVLLGTEFCLCHSYQAHFGHLGYPFLLRILPAPDVWRKCPGLIGLWLCVWKCACACTHTHTHTHTQDLHKWKTNTYKHFSISSQPLCEGEHFCYLHLIIITITYNNNNYCCCCYLQRKKYAREYIHLENGKSQDLNLGCLTTNPSWSLRCKHTEWWWNFCYLIGQ